MKSHLNILNILMLDVMNANELAYRKTYTLVIAMNVNMIYALNVKQTITKIWQIRKLKLKLMQTNFTAMVAIEWIREKVMPLGMLYNVMDVQLQDQNIKITFITVIAALMIYVIPVLFRKHPKQHPAQDKFSDANRTISLKRRVRQLNSEKNVVVMNVEKIKSKMMLITITVMIVTTIYVWTVQLPLQKY